MAKKIKEKHDFGSHGRHLWRIDLLILVCISVDENRRKSTKIEENFRKSMKIDKNQWKSTKIDENRRKSMEIDEIDKNRQKSLKTMIIRNIDSQKTRACVFKHACT
jgi:hypothetical protein